MERRRRKKQKTIKISSVAAQLVVDRYMLWEKNTDIVKHQFCHKKSILDCKVHITLSKYFLRNGWITLVPMPTTTGDTIVRALTEANRPAPPLPLANFHEIFLPLLNVHNGKEIMKKFTHLTALPEWVFSLIEVVTSSFIQLLITVHYDVGRIDIPSSKEVDSLNSLNRTKNRVPCSKAGE